MARGRMLSKRLSTSQRYARLVEVCPKLAEFAQALYPLLIAHADDFGRQQGDVFTVQHQVHPTSPRRAVDFEAALQALHDVELIVRYQVHGRDYLQVMQFDVHQVGLHKRTKSDFPEIPGNSGKFPEIPTQEKRTEEKGTEEKGTEEKGTELNRTEAKRGADAPALAALMGAWNELTTPPITKCAEMTPSRATKVRARLNERSLDEWRVVIARIERSAFCRGESERGWVASFDWLLQVDTGVKVSEGKYDNRASTPSAATCRARGPTYHGWECPHQPPCEQRGWCELKSAKEGAAVSA
jgi:hypothetical protein